ncbi:PREDICTED: ATPase WRNIP1 [Dufourea novaeangliae]|uniref:ATPase WRNIP1 n=1 Tax=Dufourea novaeangliae TaxID=178035 RepID=UPI0007676DCA|nr:PREDICTED: ATPase WRNIP1 [Dufourea novaeangliae]
MLCPICRKEFSVTSIGNHIDLCLSLINALPKESSQSLKRSLPFNKTVETNSVKKYKSSAMKNISSMNQQKAVSSKEHVPLAEKLRPACFADYIGQEQVIGSTTVLQKLLTKGCIPSIIFWGPPGCGKSSLANIISRLSKEICGDKVHITKLSATSSGVNNIRDVVNAARNGDKLNRKTIIFMDEIHRFNKLQQDIFLPHVEAGTLTLIGTTTENPSYSLNSALLSRCRVFSLNKLTVPNVMKILCKAVSFINGEIYDPESENSQNKFNSNLNSDFIINKTVIEWLAEVCDGDARVALSGLELAVKRKVLNKANPSHPVSITLENIKESLKQALSDKQTTNTHHLYSALHKSIKGDNASAALYWLARIMAIKEDPVDIARRLVRISAEDIGLADPDALGIAVHTMHGCQMIGMPECDLLLGECVVYLTRAPKSELIHNALETAKNIIMNHHGPQPVVPLHIRDRSGKRKLETILGPHQGSLVRKEENIKTHLPFGLQHTNFFLDDS